MSDAVDLEKLDLLVHERGRFVILNALAVNPQEFGFLAHLTSLTPGGVSKHVQKLEAAGLVEVHKEFVRRRPKTIVKITEAGRAAVDGHWSQLQKLREQSRLAGGTVGPEGQAS